MEKYICMVCDYVHEGPLPEDFECPVCGVGVEEFQKVEE